MAVAIPHPDLISKDAINPDIQKERDTCSFDLNSLIYFMNGGEKRFKRKVRVVKTLEKEPEMDLQLDTQVTQVERYALAFKRTSQLIRLAMKHGWSQADIECAFKYVRAGISILIHGVMFIPALQKMGTPEQKAEWLPKAMSLQVLGTYCQTELGHGTNLRGLETIVQYDPSTEEFVINTPLPSGMKWWPGGLGKTANHVLLFANLFIGKKSCGMQPFLVPIRDMETHMPLPGVEVGEIGPRLGMNFADNGYLILKNVRIPRMNMLMKNAQVTPEGEFHTRVSSKVNYSTMVMVRVRVLQYCYDYMSVCTTIATRYAAVRRQSELQPGGPEPQVLDFTTQQYKLFPAIASTYSVFFAERFMNARYEHVDKEEMRKGDYKSLPELHSLASGLKAFCSELCVSNNEICRRSCGGHGFLMTSGIANWTLDSMSTVTYEGENTVLYLQTARYLVREYQSAASGKPCSGTWSYLSDNTPPCTINTLQQCHDLTQLANAFKCMAKYVVGRVCKRLEAVLQTGIPQYEAWNKMGVQLVEATKVHVDTFMVLNFMACLVDLPLPESTRAVLTKVCVFYALHRTLQLATHFVESGALTRDQLDLIREQETEMLAVLRPDAVSLVDGFGIMDQMLGSALGSYDGNAYQKLYEAAKNSTVNQHQVIPGFMEHMRPLQQTLAKL